MSLRTSALRIANILRALPAKPSIDIRTTTVTVRTRTWTGGIRGGDGGHIDVDLVLTPTPRVRELNGNEVRGSGGRYLVGDVRVDQVTPADVANPGIGYTDAQLDPTVVTNGVEIIYVLAGAMSGEYALLDYEVDKQLTRKLTLRNTRVTP